MIIAIFLNVNLYLFFFFTVFNFFFFCIRGSGWYVCSCRWLQSWKNIPNINERQPCHEEGVCCGYPSAGGPTCCRLQPRHPQCGLVRLHGWPDPENSAEQQQDGNRLQPRHVCLTSRSVAPFKKLKGGGGTSDKKNQCKENNKQTSGDQWLPSYWLLLTNSRRRYMAETLPTRRKTLFNQSIS